MGWIIIYSKLYRIGGCAVQTIPNFIGMIAKTMYILHIQIIWKRFLSKIESCLNVIRFYNKSEHSRDVE